ncbi:MAG: hypothetical protein JKY57_01855 [Kordiimonadaceae bacterium]|nr:hypothetical protein [Kordiimonadaceae bacterium]
MLLKKLLVSTCIAASVASSFTGAAQAAKASKFNEELCASYFDKQLVRKAYFGWGGKPTDPMAIPSHTLRMVESKVTSSFSDKMALGINATPALFKEVWKSVDMWGEKTPIKVVITVDGWQAFAFPGHVPTTRKEDHANGFYDVFADDGSGLRGHISPKDVSLIYAVNLPAQDGTALRALSFYSQKGDLILGLYATEGGKPQNAEAIAGFDKSWDLLKSMPRACKTPTPNS